MMENKRQLDCELRRRRSMEGGGPNLSLNLDMGYSVSESGGCRGTPSPCGIRFANVTDSTPSCSLAEFRKKQQSFDIQIEDCEEEELCIDSDDEGDSVSERPDSPMQPLPLQDFGVNVNYKEGPQIDDYLQVKSTDHECVTDISEDESEGEDESIAESKNK